LAAAITDLNTQGVGAGGVTLNLLAGNAQAAPAGGYSVTAQGNATDQIIITGNGNIITASSAQVVGNLNDAIIKLVGADYVTIEGFVLQENAGNTVTAAATNTMTEWGIALVYATATNGAQNCTIQNNTITLNRTYQNTFAIYSNSTHTLAAPTTAASATGATGGNSGLKILTNTISNTNNGIVVAGPTATADYNTSLNITGNSITDYGTTGTFSGYSNVSGSVFGVYVKNVNNYTITGNTLTSSNGGVTAGTLRGVLIFSYSSTPTGTATNTISTNTVSLRPGATGITIAGIEVQSATTAATSTLNIASNDFVNTGHTVAGASGTVTFISAQTATGTLLVDNNTFSNLTLNTTGSVTFVNHGYTMPASASQTFSNNRIVGSFSKTGAGGTITGFTSGSSSPNGSNYTVTGNTLSNITVTGSTAITGIGNTDGSSSSPNRTVTGNTFNNWTGSTGTYTGMSFTYIGATSSISNNTYSNWNTSGSITAINAGNTFAGGNPLNISSNTLSSLVSTGGNVTGINSSTASTIVNITSNVISGLSANSTSATTGINLSGGTTVNVSKNKIYDIANSNTGGAVTGLLVSGGTTITTFNNLIGDLRTPAVSAANPLIGISLTGGTTNNVYFNTVYLNGTSTGTNFGSSALSSNGTPTTILLKNNIFIDKSTPAGTGFAVAYRRSAVALTNYSATSNNNLFYAGTPGTSRLIFYDGTNSDQTLAAFKTRVSTRETLSVTEDVNFQSTTGSNPNFLNVDTGTPTQIESAGVQITSPAITDDYAGTVRNVSTPDMGAWEGTFVPNDLTTPVIGATVFSTNACGLTGRTLTAVISDPSGVATGVNAPRIYYRINAGAYTSVAGTLTSGTVTNGTWTFNPTFTVVAGDVISYFIIAQDASTNNNIVSNPSAGLVATDVNTVTTPPTTPSTWTIQVTMAGTYTVGAGGNFTTLTAAANAYNTSCLTGPVIFSLTDATYSGAETFPITFLHNFDASSTNTLTILPATGVTASISGAASTNALIRVLGSYITIDGSNNGTTTRDLSITNTSTTTPSVLWIGNANGGVIPIVSTGIKNCILTNGVTTSTALVISDGTTLGNAGYFNGITVQNNLIQKAYIGIYARAVVAAGNGGGLNISMNNLDATATNAITFTGIYVEGVTGAVVSRNTIGNFVSTNSEVDAGIWLATGVSNSLVEKNIVHDLKYTGTSGYGCRGIALSTGLTNCNVEVSNNMIYAITGDADSYSTYGATYSPTGIYLFGTTAQTGAKIYYNTIYLSGATLNYGAQSHSIGIALDDASTGEIKNNIVINKLGRLGATGAGAVGIAAETNAAQLAQANFNDYFCAAASGTNIIGKIGGTNYTTLAAYKTASSSEANSVNIDAVFTSTTDLHLIPNSNVALNNLGTPIAVTTDIDGDARNATNPDMGADEFAPNVCMSAVGGTVTVNTDTICENQTVTIANTGSTSGVGISYQWKVSTVAGGPYTNVTGGSGATTLTYTTGALTAGTYYYVLEVTCSTGPAVALSSEDTVVVLPNPMIATNPTTATICSPGGAPVSITASGGVSYTWLPTAGLTPATGATVSANPTTTTNYTVTGTGANGCTATATASVTVNVNPVINSITATPSNLCAGGNSQLNAVVSLGASLLITEVTMYSGGTGATASYPAYITGADLVEISNISAGPVDISGYKLMDYSTNSATANHPFTFPAGTIIPGNGVAVVNLGSGTDNIANRYFNTGGSSDTYSSGGLVGIVLLNGATVVDAVGVNSGYVFNPATGVTAADWSGFASSPSSMAGTIRSVATDNNVGSDWIQSNSPSPLQTIGTYNGGYMVPATATYAWTPTTFLSDPSIINPMANAVTSTTTYTLQVSTPAGCSTTGTVTISVDPMTAIGVTATSPTVCAGVSTTITAAPVGGGTPYTYNWMPGGATTNTVSVNPSTTTDYTVTVTDACGSMLTNTITITVNPLPVVTASATATSYCTPGSPAIAITASGADTYTWLPVAGLDVTTGSAVNATPSMSTTYTVTGTDALTGCTNTATAAISAVPAVTGVTASVSDATICAGDTIDLTSSAGSLVTLLTEDFNAATNSWTIVNAGSTGTNQADAIWNLRTSPFTPAGAWTGSVSSNDNSQFMMTNSDVSGTGSVTKTTLTSPRIDASAMTTLSLSYYHFYKIFNGVDEGKVQISTNGTTFTDLQTYNANTNLQSAWAQATLNLNAYAGNDSLYLRFYYNASWDFGWGLDNLALTGASSAMNYAWTSSPAGLTSSAQNPLDVVPTASTTYSVVVSNAFGCSSSATTAVTVNAVPVVSLGNDTAVCSVGLPLTLDAGNTGSTFMWSTTAATQTISAATAGSYDVAVTDGNGCVGRDTIVISINPTPVVALGTDSVRCGGSVTLDAGNAGATYLWTDGSMAQTFVATATGTYDVEVTSPQGCIGNDTIMVTINTIPTVDLGADTLVCGTGVTLDAGNAGSTFLWSTTDATQTINATVTGAYSVIVTSLQNCSANDTINVTIAPVVVVNLGNDSAVCSSTNIILNAQNAGATYLWNDSSVGSTLNVTAPGIYAVLVTAPSGCVGQDTVVYTDNSPAVTLSLPFTTTCVNTAVNALSGGSPAGGSYSGTGVTGTNFDATVAGAGPVLITYTYTDVTTTCSATDTQTVVVDPCIGIKQLSAAASIVVAPNPTTGYFSITTPSRDNVVKAEMFTIEGQLISSETLKGRETYEMNITNLANAIYYLRLTVDGEMNVVKVVKQQ
jgi:hypothetical protein